MRIQKERETYFVELGPYFEEVREKARHEERQYQLLETEKRRSTILQGHSIELLRLKASLFANQSIY